MAAVEENFFDNRKEYSEYLIMKRIAESEGAVGSWALRDYLLENGVDYSTASIGRILKELDRQEYTFPCGNQGRTLTPLGKVKVSELSTKIDRFEVQTNLTRQVQVNSYEELIDLLCTRRALEVLTCEQACVRANKEDFKQLEKALKRHKNCVKNNEDPTEAALDFHEMIARISHNKFLNALLETLLFEERKMEARFETLVTRERGSSYVLEHIAIVEAIMERDQENASRLMRDHINVLISAIEEQLTGQKENG